MLRSIDKQSGESVESVRKSWTGKRDIARLEAWKLSAIIELDNLINGFHIRFAVTLFITDTVLIKTAVGSFADLITLPHDRPPDFG